MIEGPAEYKEYGFWRIALSREVVRRALRVSGIVGIVLAIINHGDRIMYMTIELDTVWRVLLTFCVPYCVSTYSSVLAVRDYQKYHNVK